MSQNIVLCRICLASNVRMFPIAGIPLQLVYERLTNCIMNIDSKPVTACYICYAYLKKCYKIMETSTHTEQVLESLLVTNPMVTTKSVHSIDCQSNNLFSSLKITPVEYFDSSTFFDPICLKDEPMIMDNTVVEEDSYYMNVLKKTYEDVGTFENAEVCKICLAVDVRMFAIAGTPLQLVYETITSNLLLTADTRPVAICYLCHAQLRTSHTLLVKACCADKWMTTMLEEYSELTPKMVAMVDRKSNKLYLSLGIRHVEYHDSLLDDPSVVTHELDVTVKIEIEPDVYVESPVDMLSGEENPKIQSGTEDEVSKNTSQSKRHTKRKLTVAWGNDDKQSQDDAAPIDQQKPIRCKRTKKESQNTNIKPESQHKKEKPRRGYKKRICAYIHECPVCKRLFNRSNHLIDHMKTHTDDRPFECSICQKRFIQKVNLKIHIMTHTGEKPFQCDICHTGFIAKSDFNRHLNTHKEERLFECSVCHRRFTQLPYLKAHISTHTSEKTHECHICHRRFSQKPYLKNHLKRHTDTQRVELKR